MVIAAIVALFSINAWSGVPVQSDWVRTTISTGIGAPAAGSASNPLNINCVGGCSSSGGGGATAVTSTNTVVVGTVTIQAPNGNTTPIPVSGALSVGGVMTVAVSSANGALAVTSTSTVITGSLPALSAGTSLIGDVGLTLRGGAASVTSTSTVITGTLPALSAGSAQVGTFHGSSVTISAPNGNTTAIPTSLATLPALVAGSAIVGKVGIDQTTPGTTNKVSIGTDGTIAINTALPTGTNIIGRVNGSTVAVQCLNAAGTAFESCAGGGVGGVTTVSVNVDSTTITNPTWVRNAGSTIAVTGLSGSALATESTLSSLNGKVTAVNTGAVTISAALPTGTNSIGSVGVINSGGALSATSTSTVITGSLPTGTNSIGSVGLTNSGGALAVTSTNTTVSVTGSVPVSVLGTTFTVTNPGFITPTISSIAVYGVGGTAAVPVISTTAIVLPGIAKGIQASTGITVQMMTDGGRKNIVWVLDRFSSTQAAEGVIIMQRSEDGGAYASSGTYTITSGKRLRIDSATLVVHSSGTAFNIGAQSAYFRVRYAQTLEPSVTSPVQIFVVASSSGAQVGTSFEDFPGEMEFNGTGTAKMGFFLQTPTWSATTNPVISAFIRGYEY